MATRNKPAASKSTALSVWEKEMVDHAVVQAAAEKPVGGFKKLSTRGGILAIDDTPLEDNELRCIVLVAMHENLYYTGRYDPNVPQTPACFSFGEFDSKTVEDDMEPHADSEQPQGDEDRKCAGCWANQMGSADTGRGKACKNSRRLALVTEDALNSPEEMEAAEIRTFSIPVTSVKGWANYVRIKLGDEIRRPYYGVITKIQVVPDAKTQYKALFSFEELIQFDQATYEALKRRIKEAQTSMTQPYQKPSEVADRAQPVRGPASRKAPPAAAARGKPATAPAARGKAPAAKPAAAPTKGARSKY